MGDNLVPNGLSRVAGSLTRRIHGKGPLLLGTRVRRQPRAPKARPCGLRGLTAQRGQASGCHAKNEQECLSRSQRRCHTGDIGDGRLAEWVVEGLQGLLLQVEVSQIVVHEAGEPNAVIDFLDAELLAGQHG
jgi:hypothetical protein